MDGSVRSVKAEDVVREAITAGATDAERKAWLDDAEACIKQNGLIIIRNALPRSLVTSVLEDFKVRYDVHMAPGQKKLFRNFQNDPLRAQIPFAIEGPVSDPAVFAAPSVLPLVQRMMGADIVIGEAGVVISHPGAQPQGVHRDAALLFGGMDMELDLPPYSMTMLIPLIDVELGMGPTEFWPGTHKAIDEAAATTGTPERMPLKAGTVILQDARVLHRGGANETGPVRPSVYFNYHRKWYRENPNYEEKPQVRITPAMLVKLPEVHQPLFSWALNLNRADNFDERVFRWVGRFRRFMRKLAGR